MGDNSKFYASLSRACFVILLKHVLVSNFDLYFLWYGRYLIRRKQPQQKSLAISNKMGNEVVEKRWRKNKRMNGLFRQKIEERGATFSRELIVGRVYLSTSTTKLLWDFIPRWNPLISLVTLRWCLHQNIVKTTRYKSVEQNSWCWGPDVHNIHILPCSSDPP